MAGAVPASPRIQFPSSSGGILPAGTVDVYLAGTTTRTNTWQDKALTVLNTNPIILDVAGSCLLLTDPSQSCKFVVKDANGVVQYTVDNVMGAGTFPTVAQFANDKFSGNGSQTTFSLSVTPAGKNNTEVFIAGIYQPKAAYSLVGNAITFVSAPASGTNNIEVNTLNVTDYAAVSANITAQVAAAAASAASAAHIYGSTYAVAPTTRPDGSAIQAGDIYFGTDNYEYAYIGGAWVNQTSAAAVSAAAALTSQNAASTSATSAAGSATTAAALDHIFTTTALGIAGTTNGQYFGVPQAYGDAADIYQNVAGVATPTSWTMPYTGAGQQDVQIKVAELASANLTPYPYNPAIEVYGVDSYDRNGVYVPNRYASSPASGNLVALSSGLIRVQASSTATSTQNYANGPAGLLTAMRLQMNNGQFWMPIFNETLPAGTYTVKWQMKAVSGTPTVKCGDQSVPSVSDSVLNTATWVQASFTMTATGSNTPWPIIINSSGVAVDILVDEVQIYLGTTVPAYSAEVNNQGHLVPITAKYPGKFRRAGNAMDTTGVTGGLVRLSTFPLAKSLSEVTLIAVISTNDNTTAAAKAISLTDNNGTLDVGMYWGAPFGNPAATISQTANNGGGSRASQCMSVMGKGFQIVATRCKATEQSFFWHGIEYARSVAAWGPVNTAKFSVFTDSNGTSFPLKGQGSALLVFEKWLTNAELTTVMQSLRQRHALYGLLPITTKFNFIIAEGDSITDQVSGPASNGGYVNQYFSTYTPANAYCKNIAFTGSTYANLNSRLPEIQRMAPQVLATTGKPMIVSVLIGANGVLTTGAGAQWDTYLAAVRAAGAKIVACTLLPRSGVVGFEASRIAFNAYVRANASQYDALCDFGDTASVMGQPNSYTDTPANWIDVTHPSNAGHLLLLPVWKAAVESLYT